MVDYCENMRILAISCNEKYVNFSSFSFHAVTSAPASSSTSFRSCRPCSRQKKLLCKKLRPHSVGQKKPRSVGQKKTNRRSRLVYVSLSQSWNIDQTYSFNDTTVYPCHVLCLPGVSHRLIWQTKLGQGAPRWTTSGPHPSCLWNVVTDFRDLMSIEWCSQWCSKPSDHHCASLALSIKTGSLPWGLQKLKYKSGPLLSQEISRARTHCVHL